MQLFRLSSTPPRLRSMVLRRIRREQKTSSTDSRSKTKQTPPIEERQIRQRRLPKDKAERTP